MAAIVRKKRNTRRHDFTTLSRLGMDAIGGHIAGACWCTAELIVDRRRGYNTADLAFGDACRTPEDLKEYLDEVEQTAQQILDDVVRHLDKEV